MKKELKIGILMGVISLLMTGCDTIGSKSMSMSVIYGVVAVVAVLMLSMYCIVIHKKELWFVLLFSSILVVDIGYFLLSISKNLEQALWANRIAYLGSVFLPLSMFIIIISACKLDYKKWLPGVLLFISVVVFFIAASPGYLDIYYKEVEFCIINGVGGLRKVYGDWHCIYLFYLLIYFGVMVITIMRSSVNNRLKSKVHVIVLAGAVFVNIVVWLIEQLVSIDFEILSVSYIISEFFLLCFCFMRQEEEKTYSEIIPNVIDTKQSENKDEILSEIPNQNEEQILLFIQGINSLTPTETKIYNLYLEEKTTKEVLKIMSITENTLKYHNKNIYSKLGVSSRKQLKQIAKSIK